MENLDRPFSAANSSSLRKQPIFIETVLPQEIIVANIYHFENYYPFSFYYRAKGCFVFFSYYFC